MGSGVSRQTPAGSLDDFRSDNESTNMLLRKKKCILSLMETKFFSVLFSYDF